MNRPGPEYTRPRVEIKGRDGKVLSSSKNLAGLRRWAGTYVISNTFTKRLPDGRGWLRIEFVGGQVCTTEFESFAVMFDRFLIPVRSFHQAPIWINGRRCGYLGKHFTTHREA